MIKKQVYYCEYCGASFVGEGAADQCLKHESSHAKEMIANEIEASCVDASMTSGTIIPQALIIPYNEKRMYGPYRSKTYAVYKLVNQYNSQKQGSAKEAAEQAAKEITKNDFFFKLELKDYKIG